MRYGLYNDVTEGQLLWGRPGDVFTLEAWTSGLTPSGGNLRCTLEACVGSFTGG
jgi:hypothetical protein